MQDDATDTIEETADSVEETAAGAEEPPIALIAAVAANGVIGRDGEMPWHYPEDLKRFKSLTTGNPVIMGRRTYDSIAARIGGPLPDRMNIVLSRSEPDLPSDVVVADSVEQAIEEATAACKLESAADEIFVIGGATVYEQFLDQADRLYLTELASSYEGDTTFPDWDRSQWVEVDRDSHEEFSFVTYQRA